MNKWLSSFLHSRSIVVKLMSAFVLVMLPLYTLGILLTQYSSSQMKDEVERANESKLNFYYSHLEFELERMSDLINEYAFDDTLSNFSTRVPIMNRYDRDYNLNIIYSKLKQIKETSPYIGDVVYYVPIIGKRVSALDGTRDADDEEWQELSATMGNLDGDLSYYEHQLYFLRSNPFNLDPSEPPNFLLGIRLSTEQLQLRLQDFAAKGGSDITLVVGARNEYVLSSAASVGPEQLGVTAAEKEDKDEALIRQRIGESITYTLFNPDNHYRLTTSISEKELNRPLNRYNQWLWLLTGLSLITVLLFSWWTYQTIHRPLAVLIQGFKRAERGQTGLLISVSRKDEFGYLYSRFNEMLRRLRTLIDENYVQRIRTSEAELKHLQSQITPHFLYNSLFSIKQMAEVENVELIKEFTDYLGQYFRYMTRDQALEVSLGEEMDHALVYLAIQKIRFGSRITSEVEELEPGYRSLHVPRVLLQPLIENAFEHALQHKSVKGVLRLTTKTEAGDLVIRVEDNGDRLSDDKLEELQYQLAGSDYYQGEITGLLNVSQRMRIKFGASYHLRVSRSELGGLCVQIRFPVIREGR